MTNAPAGWYPNPYDTSVELYWDGDDWTSSSRPAGGTSTEPPAAAPVEEVAEAAVEAPAAALATTPAGWYDDGSGRQRWWDGTIWTDSYQDVPAAPVAQDPPSPAAPAKPARPRPRWFTPALIGGGAVLAIGAVILGAVLLQPRYPSTAPLDSAALDALVLKVAGVQLPQHMSDASILDGTTPYGCGIIAQLGSGLRTMSDADSGLTFYQVWGYADGDGAPWTNARLFATPEAAQDFMGRVEDALTTCPRFTRPGESQALTATNVASADDTVRFDYPSPGTHVVLTRKDNAVFVLLFDQVPEDPSYLEAIRG